MRDYTTSIVIPIYKNWKLCHSLLTSIRRWEPEIDEVIVVDDCSEDPEVDGGLEFWIDSKLIPVQVVKTEKNGGFTISSNVGLRFAEKPIATRHISFLISSDVKVTGKFIDQSAEILLGAKRAFLGNRHILFDTGWNNFDGRIFDYLEGWFLACTSDGWRDLGYFDEEYAPYDYEDIDISTTAKSKGYKLASLNNPNIHHKGAGTIGFNPQREAITTRNKEYFRSKWTK